ncbi:hypothetical protein, partial [Xanthomonas arboricola]|uniref:hypothetical protein n=1 Tax=Xanthomonas arboricola TaxID=56448 RepID=UPI001CA4AF0B
SVAENQSLTRDGSNLRRRSEVYRGVVQSFPNALMYKEILSMALTSLQSKNTVEIYVDGCNGNSMQIKAFTVAE